MAQPFRLTRDLMGRVFVATPSSIDNMRKSSDRDDYPDLGPAPMTFEATGLSLYDALEIWAYGASAIGAAFWPRAAMQYVSEARKSRIGDHLPTIVEAIDGFVTAVGKIPCSKYTYKRPIVQAESLTWHIYAFIHLEKDGEGWAVRMYGEDEAQLRALKIKRNSIGR